MLCKKPYQKKRTGIVHPVLIKGDQYRNDITPFPCGQCFHCRVNQSRIWQARLILEAQDSFDSTFLTLTYDDDNVPWDYNLVKEDLTLFLKRYRKRLGHKIRYFAIGEYGDKTWRPHFHLAIFSEMALERCIMPCEDMRKRNLCTQDCIARLAWGKGNVSVTANLSSDLAGYITGYIKEKATKKSKINRVSEYATQSRGRHSDGNGGIGFRAIKKIADKFKDDPRAGSKVIRSLRISGGLRPLGGYLTKVLSDQLGVSESVIHSEFVKYSDEIYSENIKEGKLVPEILRKSEGKRDSQRVKHTRFKRRKRL